MTKCVSCKRKGISDGEEREGVVWSGWGGEGRGRMEWVVRDGVR